MTALGIRDDCIGSVITVLWIRDDGKLHDDCSGHRQSLFRPIRRANAVSPYPLGQRCFVLSVEPMPFCPIPRANVVSFYQLGQCSFVLFLAPTLCRPICCSSNVFTHVISNVFTYVIPVTLLSRDPFLALAFHSIAPMSLCC